MGQKNPAIVRIWENAWLELVPFLEVDTEICQIVCTTNAIGPVNARIRRAVRARGHYLAVTSLDPIGTGRNPWTNHWKRACTPSTSPSTAASPTTTRQTHTNCDRCRSDFVRGYVSCSEATKLVDGICVPLRSRPNGSGCGWVTWRYWSSGPPGQPQRMQCVCVGKVSAVKATAIADDRGGMLGPIPYGLPGRMTRPTHAVKVSVSVSGTFRRQKFRWATAPRLCRDGQAVTPLRKGHKIVPPEVLQARRRAETDTSPGGSHRTCSGRP
ncbi:transposase [Streptomyces sp900105245]|uniref:Transposase n=1 Tax=Streptomyces sp. 900105245 TaxID=3154379 RepID=A0ABV1UMS1_9ACTN